MTVHRSAVVATDVTLGADAEVGPFCVVGEDGPGGPPAVGTGLRLRSHVVLYRGTILGHRFHAAHHVLIREDSVIGDDVSIGTGSTVEHHVSIGDGVRVHGGCFVPEHSVLEAGAWLGPGVVLTNARYPNRPDTKQHLEGVTVGTGAVLGASVVVLPGITIGAGALVGAGSVVTRDVPPGTTVMGSPAGIRR